MKKICICLCLLQLIPATTYGAESIAFVAQANSEALAEEAILLLHCLASRSNTNWEFSGEVRGNHWLKVTEKGGKLQGTYQRAAKTQEFALQEGGSDQTCDTLEPPIPGSAIRESSGNTLSPALSTAELGAETPSFNKTWIWAGLGAAAVLGFFYWKSKQADHHGITMQN